MKRITYGIWLLMLMALVACSGPESSSSTPDAGPQQLTIGRASYGHIDAVAQVDTFHLRANEANRFLKISCAETDTPTTPEELRSTVDLLVTVYEDVNGQRVRLYGRHEPENATNSATFDLWVYVDRPKDLIVQVRDLMDDDASTIPYRLTATFEGASGENHDFANAREIAIDAAAPLNDYIGVTGEEDCFTFAPAADGIYSVNVTHNKVVGTPVQLAISLYDHSGNRIQRVSEPEDIILGNLTQADGPYFVIVEDKDSTEGDASSTYDISVTSATANDNGEQETVMPPVAGVYTAEGAVEYGCSSMGTGLDISADTDWFSFDLSGGATYKWMTVSVDDGDAINGGAEMRVTVRDGDRNIITSHDFVPGSPEYQNQFRAENGTYYVTVAPADPKELDRSATYRVQLEEATLTDTFEGADSNTIADAFPLVNGVTLEDRFVSYPSDVDWYSISVNTATGPQMLSIEFNATGTSVVDYQVAIYLSDGTTQVKRVTDADGTDRATNLKTSILVTESTDYMIRVGDAQNNEGSDTSYNIVANVDQTPATVAHAAGRTSGALEYYHETTEEPGAAASVELEFRSTDQTVYKANTEYLDYRNNPDVVESTDANGNPVLTLPWVAGYIDYDGDRDFFQLDFNKLDPAGAELHWYYDVEIRMVVPAGTDVEHVWKLYRDGNVNPGTPVIRDDDESRDGYKAIDGDTTPQSMAEMDITSPNPSDPARNVRFWMGSLWDYDPSEDAGAEAKFYLGISDFNYLLLPDETTNPLADNDAGYAAPYYFQVKLTYHAGVACPSGVDGCNF